MKHHVFILPIFAAFSVTAYAQTAPSSYSEQLRLAQAALAASPNDPALVRAIYQAAARLNLHPLQEQLIAEHPTFFSKTDELWLKHDKAVFLSRVGSQVESREQTEQALDELNQVIAEAPANSAVARKSEYDRFSLLVNLHRYEQAVREYPRLVEPPVYVKEAYADALVALGRPFKALDVYATVPAPSKRKLVAVYADAGRYQQAIQLLNELPQVPKIGDFTRTALMRNPQYTEHNFTRIQLTAWRGDTDKANVMIDEWLAVAPSDAWGTMLKGDIARWQGLPDDALVWYQKAYDLMPEKTRSAVVGRMANAYLDQGNRPAAQAQRAQLPADSEVLEALNERFKWDETAQLSLNYARQRLPLMSDETHSDSYLYSTKNDAGHRLYVHHFDGQSPKNKMNLQSGGVGLGAQLQWYPLNVTLETGRGTHLNRRGYAWISADYRANQNWQLGLKLKLNSDQTPVSALNDGVYAKNAGVTVQYSANEFFRMGASIDALKFSDGNLRRSAGLWLSHDWIRHDRWRLNFMGDAHVSQNKIIANASYFNPHHDSSVNGQLALSYRQPMDRKSSLIHTLSAGAGRYWQSGYQPAATWSWSYGQEWNLGSRWSLAYELGRKKSIYDGAVEFKNFAAAHVNVRF